MGIKIALVGNPNSGKTTLFNVLTGSNQFVGNWPGVTVEKKEGRLVADETVTLTDLPGIYSLSPYTAEEIIARNYLINDGVDVILNIVDGTNLERNLYLTTQLTELGIPVVLAVNMIDAVRKNGDKLDIAKLSKEMGCHAVVVSALKSEGIDEAVNAAISAAGTKTMPKHSFSGCVEHCLAHIEEAVFHGMPAEKQRWYAVKLFERDEELISLLKLEDFVLSHIEEDIRSAEEELDDDAESIIANERYVFIEKVINKCFVKAKNILSVSQRIDRIVTNRFLAFPIFALVMFLVYFLSVSTVGAWATDWVNDGLFGEGWHLFGSDLWVPSIPISAEQGLTSIGCAAWLVSLVVDGIIGGVGAVLGFLPQMAVLFLLLSFLESCGYMTRIAFVLDRVFRRFGLSGKSFIPMLIGTGCGVPGIMASRTIEGEADRRMTVITTTFIPCSAKLPIIAMVASTLFGGAWWLAPLAYFAGIASIIISGIILKKTKLFSGGTTPFVMELPAYRLPSAKNLFRTVLDRLSAFAKKASTVILLSSVLIWAGTVFGFVNGKVAFSLDMSLNDSFLGYMGNAIRHIFSPLGFDSISAAVATVMGLVAKEEVVAVFGVIDLEGMTRLSGISFLMFNLLCAPCFAAMGAIRREMNSFKWTAFAIAYQCVFAYAVSLMIYQFGSAVKGSISLVPLMSASAVFLFGIYMLFIKRKKENDYACVDKR